MQVRGKEGELQRPLFWPINLQVLDRPVPLGNNLLETISQAIITPEAYEEIVKTIPPDAATKKLLDVMNRSGDEVTGFEGDTTGLVSEYIGRCSTSQEVEKQLIDSGKELLAFLTQQDKEVPNEVAAALRGQSCTVRALLVIDDMNRLLATHLKSERRTAVEEYRQRNLDAIAQEDREHQERERTRNEMEHGRFTLNTSGIYPGIRSDPPGVSYIPRFVGNRLVEIAEHIVVPKLPPENIEILRRLTPKMFRRGYQVPKQQGPLDAAEVMELVRKGGDPVARGIAEWFREFERNAQNILREQSLRENIDRQP